MENTLGEEGPKSHRSKDMFGWSNNSEVQVFTSQNCQPRPIFFEEVKARAQQFGAHFHQTKHM